jgi:8-oxo-dGTP diphosphatase
MIFAIPLFLLVVGTFIVLETFRREGVESTRNSNKKDTNMSTPTVKRGTWQFCPACGGPLALGDADGKERLKCGICPFVHWDNPKPVAVILIPKGDGLVLVTRKLDPGKGLLALPGGFVDKGENPRIAAVREAKEETGLDIEIERLIHEFNLPAANQNLYFFLAKPVTADPVAGDDAAAAGVYKPADVPDDQIAFSSHREAIAIWVEELKKAA